MIGIGATCLGFALGWLLNLIGAMTSPLLGCTIVAWLGIILAMLYGSSFSLIFLGFLLGLIGHFSFLEMIKDRHS